MLYHYLSRMLLDVGIVRTSLIMLRMEAMQALTLLQFALMSTYMRLVKRIYMVTRVYECLEYWI
jgi:hypothetical protein